MLDGSGNPFDVMQSPNLLGLQIQHLVGVAGMVSHIANEHAVFATIGEFTSKLLGVICDTNLTKNMERVEIWGVSLEEQVKRRVSSNPGCQIFHFGGSVHALSPESLLEVFVLCDESG